MDPEYDAEGPPDAPAVGHCDRPGHDRTKPRRVYLFGAPDRPQRLCRACLDELRRRGEWGRK